MQQFYDIYTYIHQIPQKISTNQTSATVPPATASRTSYGKREGGEAGRGSVEQKSSEIFLLARTTTPRTLPSNMFLATGGDIQYSMVYDFDSKEYYILATNLLKKYYKNTEDYLLIRTFKGKELAGLHYQPLFDYIPKSNIKPEFKDQFFQILNADFVSTEDGTGIVHVAPTFGEEDFQAVCKLL